MYISETHLIPARDYSGAYRVDTSHLMHHTHTGRPEYYTRSSLLLSLLVSPTNITNYPTDLSQYLPLYETQQNDSKDLTRPRAHETCSRRLAHSQPQSQVLNPWSRDHIPDTDWSPVADGQCDRQSQRASNTTERQSKRQTQTH